MSPHATRSRYQQGCRCRRCQKAKAKAERQYRAECGADSFVSAKRTIEHLQYLNQNSCLLARLTGLRSTTIDLLPTRTRILKSTERKILSVNRTTIERYFAVTRKGFIPVRIVQTLLWDLEASGFSMLGLGRKAGLKAALRVRHGQVQAGNARRIEEIYRKTGTA